MTTLILGMTDSNFLFALLIVIAIVVFIAVYLSAKRSGN
jgi:hypothetical protein